MQLTLDVEIHTKENNALSQSHLDANKELFTESCFKVLEALVSGEILTTDNAKEKAGTRSLPRRVKDLRDNMGIRITDEWVIVGGRKSHLKWFMSEEDRAENLKILMSKLKKAA